MEKSNFQKIKDFLKKFWDIVWRDESLKGWIISVIFIFVVIKFIFFPLMSLVTGSSIPLAIVESCSMYHEGNLFSDYDKWWERHENKYQRLGFSKQEFSQFSFNNGFSKGDILLIAGQKPKNIEEGDVIIFDAGKRNPLIHRVIDKRSEGGNYEFSTLGDNNNAQLPKERNIQGEQIMGKAVARIAPGLGWVKLIFYEPLKPERQKGFCDET
ncbi:MAG: signal peptidase I [Candidatus Pacearchaeota archaeon]